MRKKVNKYAFWSDDLLRDKTDKSAEEIVDKNDIDKGPPHWVTKKSAIISCNEYAAQQLSEYKEQFRKLLIDRINKSEQERRICTPGSDAYILMLGHKYEATKLLELIDKLQPTPASSISEYKETIKELLPLAEIGQGWYPGKAAIIDRAKKLIEK